MDSKTQTNRQDPRRLIFLLQGGYYVFSGIWPLVHLSSFLWLTGPKTDLWLVKMVGLLAAVIGIVILTAVLRRRLLFEILLLSGCAAAAFFAVDVFYVLAGRISPVYLLDAGAEAFFAVTAASVMIKRIDAAEEKPQSRSPGKFDRTA